MNVKKKRSNYSRLKWTYSVVSKFIQEGKRLPLLNVGKTFTDEETRQLIQDFQSERDASKIRAYLLVLRNTKYSGDISFILPLLDSGDEMIPYCATDILSQIEDIRIRDVIEHKKQDLSYLGEHIRLFEKNLKDIDIHIFQDILQGLDNECQIHDFSTKIVKIFKVNNVAKPSRLLNKLYRLNNCSICRKSIIELLLESNDLADNIYSELQYDCNPNIRELAAAIAC